MCFYFNDTSPTAIYTLSLHDALPIYRRRFGCKAQRPHPDDLSSGRYSVERIRAARGDGAKRGAVHRDIRADDGGDRKSTRLNSSHSQISYAVFCLKKKKKKKKKKHTT